MILSVINDVFVSNWLILVMLFVTLILFRYLFSRNSRIKLTLHQEIMKFLFLFYLFIYFGYLNKITLNPGTDINFIPIINLLDYELFSNMFMKNIVGLLVMSIPLGYYFCYFVAKKKLFITFTGSLFLSVVYEVIKYFRIERFDIDHLILMTFGSLLGYALYEIFNIFKRITPKFLQSDLLYNILCIIIVIVLVIHFSRVLGVY